MQEIDMGLEEQQTIQDTVQQACTVSIELQQIAEQCTQEALATVNLWHEDKQGEFLENIYQQMWVFQEIPQLKMTVIQTEQGVDQYIKEYKIEWERHSTLVKIEWILNNIWQRLEKTPEKQDED